MESHHDKEAYETSLVLNLPTILKWWTATALHRALQLPAAMQLPLRVCRLCASAQGVPACEASDLLNGRAAHETGGGGGNRTRSLTAYEAAAFPPGSPAI